MNSRICSIHFKHIEAFCLQDLTLLCINCILQGGHKSHQFCSLNDAVKSEQDLFLSHSLHQEENQNKSIEFLKGLEEYAQYLTQIQETQLKEINGFFVDIKRIVSDREQSLKNKVHDSIQKEFTMVRQANLYFQEIVQHISLYQQEAHIIESVKDDIGFLNDAGKRHQILQQLKTQVKYPELKMKLTDISKEQETNIIIKSLLSMKLGTSSVKQQRQSQGKKNTFHTNTSCKDINLFKKSGIKTSEKRIPLGESSSQLLLPHTSQSLTSKNIVSINLQKRQNDPKQQQKSLRLTNLHEARSLVKERSQERQSDLTYSYDHKSVTPRKMNRSQSKQNHIIYEISPHKNSGMAKFGDNTSSTSQYESFGQYANQSLPYQHEDSIKNEYGTFLNSNMSDEVSSVNRSDISQLYLNMNYSFITLGGFIESQTQMIEIYDPKRDLSEQYDTMQTNRSKFAAVKLPSGNILIMGGKQDGIRVNTCGEYSVKDKRYFDSRIKLNSQRSGFGVVQINGTIYAIGGNDGTGAINAVDCYNQQTQKWFKCASMHDKRDELAVVHGSDNHIYAVGGYGGVSNTCLTSCERYIISKNYWEPIASMTIARRALAAVSMPDGIYTIGGFNGSSYLSSVEKYDEQLDRWHQIAQLNQARCTLSAVSTPDNLFIYVFGGFDNGPLDKVERYSVLNEQWEFCPQMLAKRFMHQTLVLIK